MSVLYKCEYHHDGTNDLASVCFSLMEPDKIDPSGARLHRIFSGLRHERFEWHILIDGVLEGLGLCYISKDKVDYAYEWWRECEPGEVFATRTVINADGTQTVERYTTREAPPTPEPHRVTLSINDLKEAIKPPVPANIVVNGGFSIPVPPSREILNDALLPFARLGVQIMDLPFSDTEPFPGTVPVGWLRQAARALGVRGANDAQLDRWSSPKTGTT